MTANPSHLTVKFISIINLTDAVAGLMPRRAAGSLDMMHRGGGGNDASRAGLGDLHPRRAALAVDENKKSILQGRRLIA